MLTLLFWGVAAFAAPSDDAPVLFIGPIPGLTTVWHPVPARTSIALGTTVQLKRRLPAGASILWKGADPKPADEGWSLAECPMVALGRHVVEVETTEAGGRIRRESVIFDVEAISLGFLRSSGISAWVRPFEPGSVGSRDTAARGFLDPSIATLRQIGPNAYRTSVNRKVRFSLDLKPVGLSPLIEWTVLRRNHPDEWVEELGPIFEHSFPEPGEYRIRAGAGARQWEVRLQVYNVEITSHRTRVQQIAEGVPVTFRAVTDPPGLEGEITWLASTKYGTSSPWVGKGPEFTVRFEGSFERSSPSESLSQWLGVKADNAKFQQDVTAGECPTSLLLDTPTNLAVLPSNQQVRIEADFDRPLGELGLADGEIVAEAPDGTIVPIASGDLRSLSNPGRVDRIWSLEGLFSGRYLLRVTAVPAGCPSVRDEASVFVNDPPAVGLQLVRCSREDEGVSAVFEAIVEDAEGDLLTEVRWSPGDGTPDEVTLDGTTFQHFFRHAPTSEDFMVGVTISDVWGGTGRKRVRFQPKLCQVAAPRDCGCLTMRVSSGGFVTYCVPAAMTQLPPGCRVDPAVPLPGCIRPANNAVRCNLGPVDPGALNSLGMSFHVDADLDPATTDLTACERGQLARATRSLNPPVGPVVPPQPQSFPSGTPLVLDNPAPGGPAIQIDVVHPPLPVPSFQGPKFGADDYTGPGLFGEETLNGGSKSIGWLDIPHLPVPPGSRSASQEDEFVAFVKGNLGQCWCRFRVRQSWTAQGGRRSIPDGTPPERMEIVGGKNCPH